MKTRSEKLKERKERDKEKERYEKVVVLKRSAMKEICDEGDGTVCSC